MRSDKNFLIADGGWEYPGSCGGQTCRTPAFAGDAGDLERNLVVEIAAARKVLAFAAALIQRKPAKKSLCV